jgi:hypothetical protein
LFVLVFKVENAVIILFDLLIQVLLFIFENISVCGQTLHLPLDLFELPSVRFAFFTVAHVLLLVLFKVLNAVVLKLDLFLELGESQFLLTFPFLLMKVYLLEVLCSDLVKLLFLSGSLL